MGRNILPKVELELALAIEDLRAPVQQQSRVGGTLSVFCIYGVK